MKRFSPSVPYEKFLFKRLKDHRLAAAYLEYNLDEKDKYYFLVALKNIVMAYGGMLKLSRKTKLSRPNLYRMMSKKGNPEIMTLNKVLNALGLRLSVAPLEKDVRKQKNLKNKEEDENLTL